MRVTVCFFAMDPQIVRSRLADTSRVMSLAMERLRQDSNSDDALHRRILTEIVENSCPEECSYEYFSYLWNILCVVAEEIEIPEFVYLRSHGILDEIGIWSWFQSGDIPFPVPQTSDPPPEVGFMSLEDIQTAVEWGFDGLPSCSFDSEQTRLVFKEVLETLIEDELGMMAILLPA